MLMRILKYLEMYSLTMTVSDHVGCFYYYDHSACCHLRVTLHALRPHPSSPSLTFAFRRPFVQVPSVFGRTPTAWL